jgi:hypothetical protein
MVMHACNPSYWGDRGRRISRLAWGKLAKSCLKKQKQKQNTNKRAEGIAEMVEDLPSIPSTTKVNK